MKFSQLPLGQRFVFQGDVYAKIGPMTARRERDGQHRLIPRSAILAPAELATQAQAETRASGRAADSCTAALDAYERELRAALADEDTEWAHRLEAAIERGRTAFAAAMAPVKAR